ncbi:MAG: hypothetical protein GHCLOJNM_03620 [bacterium]|nr:hypothetical protein [bacterium]
MSLTGPQVAEKWIEEIREIDDSRAEVVVRTAEGELASIEVYRFLAPLPSEWRSPRMETHQLAK